MWLKRTMDQEIDMLWRWIFTHPEKATRIVDKLSENKEVTSNSIHRYNLNVLKSRLVFRFCDYEQAKSFLELAVQDEPINLSALQQSRYALIKGLLCVIEGNLLEGKQLLELSLKWALDIPESCRDTFLLVSIYYNLGEVIKSTYDEYALAYEYFKMATSDALRISHPELPRLMMAEATCSALLGDESQAQLLCEAAVKAMKKTKNFRGKAAFYGLAAQMQWEMGRFSAAKIYIQEADQWTDMESDHYTKIDLLIMKGKIAYSELCYEEALSFADQASDIMNKAGIITHTNELHLLFKVVKAALGDYGQASIHGEVYSSFQKRNRVLESRKRF